MISNYLMIFIGIANIIAILLVYFSFEKTSEKAKRVFSTMIAVGAMYIIMSVIYFLSSIALEKYTGSDTAKNMLTMAFVPVNSILLLPSIIRSVIAAKNKKIDNKSLKRRIIIIAVVAVAVFVAEFIYCRSSQVDLIKKIEENKSQNSVTNTATESNNVVENTILENTTSNEVNVENQVTNSTTNTVISNSVSNGANNNVNSVNTVITTK